MSQNPTRLAPGTGTPRRTNPQKKELDHGRTQATPPQAGPPGPPKTTPPNKTTKQATTTSPAAPRRDKTMASIFGTLLSSQGSGAHRIRPSGHPSGQLFKLTRSASPVSTSLTGFTARRF